MAYYKSASGKTYTSQAAAGAGATQVSSPQKYTSPKKVLAVTRQTPSGGTVTVTSGGKVTERGIAGEVIKTYPTSPSSATRFVREESGVVEKAVATQSELKSQLTKQYQTIIEKQRAAGYGLAGYTAQQKKEIREGIAGAYKFKPSEKLAGKIIQQQPEILAEYQREFRQTTGMQIAPSYKFMQKVGKEYPSIEEIRFKEAHPIQAKYREIEEAVAKKTTGRLPELKETFKRLSKEPVPYVSLIKPPKFFSKIKRVGLGVEAGAYQEIREKPVKTAALVGLGFGLPIAVAGIKYAVAGTKVAAVTVKAAAAYPTTAKVLGFGAKYGLPVAYAGVKGYELYKAPTTFEKGKVIGKAGVEVGAILAGGAAGAKFAKPIMYQAQIKSAAAQLPSGQRAAFKRYIKLAPKLKAPRVVEPSLKKVELLRGQPKGAGKVLLKHAQARGDILGGSVSQTAQVPKAVARKITPSDIDMYAKVVNGKDAWAKVGKSYVQAYTKAGIKGSDWYYVSAKATRPEHLLIRIGGKKIASIFPQKFLYQNIIEAGHVFPSTQITKTPKGLRILKIDVQAQRKVIAGFLQGRPKDIPHFKMLAKGIKPRKWYDFAALDKKGELKIGRGYDTWTEKPVWKSIQESLKKTRIKRLTELKIFKLKHKGMSPGELESFKRFDLGKKAEVYLTPKGVPPSPIKIEKPVVYKPYGFPRAEPTISTILSPPPYTSPKKPKDYKTPPPPLVPTKTVPYKVAPPPTPIKPTPYITPSPAVPYTTPAGVPGVTPPPYITPPPPEPPTPPPPYIKPPEPPPPPSIVPPPTEIIKLRREEKKPKRFITIPKPFPKLKKAYAFTLWKPIIKVKAGKLPSVVRSLGAKVYTGLGPRPKVVIGISKAKKKKKKKKR